MNYLFIGFLAAVVSSTVAVAQNLSPFRVPDVWKRFTTNSFSQGPQRFVSDGKGGLMFWFQMLDRVNDQLTGAPILLRADGSVDPVFKPGILGFSVDSVAPAPGGRWWVAYSTDKASVVTRLRGDGSPDPTVTPTGFSQSVRFLTPLPDDTVLVTISGFIRTDLHAGVIDTPLPTVVKLKLNGEVDPSFERPLFDGPGFLYVPPLLDSQGRFFLGGSFSTTGSPRRVNFARYLADGTLDPSFKGSSTLPQSLGGVVRGLGLQKDGKLVVVGDLRMPAVVSGGSTTNRFVALRFDSDGNHDATFKSLRRTEIMTSDYPRMMVIQPDDRIVLSATGLRRLNPDGSLDGTFKTVVSPQPTFWVASMDDGRLVLPGADPDRGVSVFTANGDPDRSFDVRGFGSSVITSYTPLPDGRVALAGRFNRAGTGPANGILLLGTNGVPDAAFPGVTKLAPGGAIEIDGNWLQVAPAGNEGLFVLGRIAAPDGGIAFSGLRRIRWDGTVDERGVGRPETVGVSGFSTRDGSLWLAASPEVQQVLDSTPATSTSVADGGFWLTRLEASGLPFPGFQPFPAGLVARLSRLDRSAGILRLGGLRLIGEGRGGAVFVEITTIDGEAMIRRVDPSGNVSGVFLPPPIAGETFGPYFSAALDPVTGQEMQWEVYWNLGRFHSAIELSDGSTLVGGRFARFPGATPGALVLLRSDGQVDAGFKPLAFGVSRPFVDPSVLSIAVDAQDRIYVAGDFDRYGDTPVSGLIRLDRTGRLDPSFASPLTITGYPEPAADLRLIGSSLWVGGSFRSADETFPRALWKLDIGPTPAAPTIAWSMADGGRVLLTWRSEPGLVLEVSNDLSGNGHWLGNPLTVSDSEGASRVEIPATMQTAFFRLRRPAP